ncbi:methyltransferase domain-containing protein [Amnibacterium sp. CER49]|uniref:class I SAM-dependent methyltransferase n=1 Tax=Amnibacterium sp. CER49 TaxID=3039161 RepID=UPI002448CED4|nr:class I SAM-dependent methyltransferase [Amnibacterium sp. CER49]MDH2442517.1 methyltransferase domain-containing protein [Amnibacterium sp. CER49]
MRGPDPHFADPRLAALYDVFDDRRDDLDAYVALLEERGARSVLDVGCGTGVLALRLAERGIEVTGVDPAAASLDVARAKPGAGRVRWLLGDATTLPPLLQVEAAVMTGNVAQVFLTDDDWAATLAGIARALRPGGTLVLESRRPEARAWLGWTPQHSLLRRSVPGVGEVTTEGEVTRVELPFVSFRTTYRFPREGEALVSHSTLRFRTQEELETSLAAAGFAVEDVREAPDRPGLELVLVATRV